MDNLIGHSITVFLAFFAVMNPIANAAAFVGLTGGQDQAARKQTALKSVVTAFCIILFFCMLGKTIFELFGITLPALRITGGVLIFLVGFHMLQGQPSKMHLPQKVPTEDDPADETNVAISQRYVHHFVRCAVRQLRPDRHRSTGVAPCDPFAAFDRPRRR